MCHVCRAIVPFLKCSPGALTDEGLEGRRALTAAVPEAVVLDQVLPDAVGAMLKQEAIDLFQRQRVAHSPPPPPTPNSLLSVEFVDDDDDVCTLMLQDGRLQCWCGEDLVMEQIPKLFARPSTGAVWFGNLLCQIAAPYGDKLAEIRQLSSNAGAPRCACD